ncbi:hypothetical protein [Nocardia fluminea]|uniref:hypothetical protein n=1 Tax=Nocardia fluminea TaxID=134984 RepID=UPI0026C85D0A
MELGELVGRGGIGVGVCFGPGFQDLGEVVVGVGVQDRVGIWDQPHQPFALEVVTASPPRAQPAQRCIAWVEGEDLDHVVEHVPVGVGRQLECGAERTLGGATVTLEGELDRGDRIEERRRARFRHWCGGGIGLSGGM